MKSEWRQQRNDAITYFTRSRIFSALGTVLPKSLKIDSRLDVREVKAGSVRALSRYFGMKFLKT